MINGCEWCEKRPAQLTSEYCIECEWEFSCVSVDQVYSDWVISKEFYSDSSVYHTCIRCGELVNGVNASVGHWEKKHKSKLYPDGFQLEIEAETEVVET